MTTGYGYIARLWRKGFTMTETDFMLLCVEHNIAPQCALEDENLVQALKDKDWERVRYIMLHEM